MSSLCNSKRNFLLLLVVYSLGLLTSFFVFLSPTKYNDEIKGLTEPKVRDGLFAFEGENGNHLSSIQSLRQQEMGSNLVLLVTYLRSGSTWLGDITTQSQGSFYVYEPFQFLIRGGSFYSLNGLCLNNFTCRDPQSEIEESRFAINNLLKIFSCDFESVHQRVFYNIAKRNRKTCFDSNRTLSNCHSILTSACQSASQRVVKTIRLTMTVVKLLMEEFHRLKVIHLVRDPRGVINSRRGTGFSRPQYVQSHARGLCDRMLADVAMSHILRYQYQGRIKTVMYEAIAERPVDAAKYIYQFLGIPFTVTEEQWVLTHSYGNTSNGGYGTMRASSVNTAYRWRLSLPYHDVTVIDSECRGAYNILGYLPMRHEVDIRNYSVKSRDVSSTDHFV